MSLSEGVSRGSVLRLEVHGVEHEGPLVGLFVEDLAGRLARAVAGVGLDADQDRVSTGMGGLEARGGLVLPSIDHGRVVFFVAFWERLACTPAWFRDVLTRLDALLPVAQRPVLPA